MGNAMSFAYGHLRRYAYRYNAEFRAHKFIEKEKLPPAPRHRKTEPAYEDPKIMEEITQKNEKLGGFLKEVYLKSEGQNPEIVSKKELPQLRVTRHEGVVFIEPKEVPEGTCTLTNIFKFLNDHTENPDSCTASVIAEKYNLDKDKVEKILKYYGLFGVYLQEKEPEKGLLDAVKNFADKKIEITPPEPEDDSDFRKLLKDRKKIAGKN